VIHRLAVVVSLLAIFAATGCGGYNPAASFRPTSGVSAERAPRVDQMNIKRIGVLPFRNESGVPNAGQRLATIFYEGLAPTTPYEVEPPPSTDEDDELQFQFRRQAEQRKGVRNEEQDKKWLKEKINNFVSSVEPYVTNLDLIYPGEYFEGKIDSKKKPGGKGTVAQSQPGEGDTPALDAYLTGVVTTYRDRSGNAVLGEKGSHVTYTAYLVSAKDGSILWQASFDEEQLYLLDNLLYLPRYAKNGFLWQSNDTLARNGLERVLATFPGLREKLEEPQPEENTTQ
jgi:hypothetical protein